MALVGAVKIGSTTVSALAAQKLDAPIFRRSRALSLIRRDPNEARRLLQQVTEEYLDEFRRAGVTHVVMAGGELLRRQPTLLSRPVWILSPQEEGKWAWVAVQAQAIGRVTIVDIGGGSTELVNYRHSRSVPIGVELEDGQMSWPEWDIDTTEIFLLGGTAWGIGTLAGVPAGVPIARERLDALWRQYAHMPVKQLGALGLSQERARLIGRGLTLVHELMDRYGWDRLCWTERGLLEGLWLAASLGRGLPL